MCCFHLVLGPQPRVIHVNVSPCGCDGEDQALRLDSYSFPSSRHLRADGYDDRIRRVRDSWRMFMPFTSVANRLVVSNLIPSPHPYSFFACSKNFYDTFSIVVKFDIPKSTH
jgi:hypothetical protein